MNDRMDKIDIYNNSAIILERKTPNNFIYLIVILISLFINTIVFIYLYISDFPVLETSADVERVNI